MYSGSMPPRLDPCEKLKPVACSSESARALEDGSLTGCPPNTGTTSPQLHMKAATAIHATTSAASHSSGKKGKIIREGTVPIASIATLIMDTATLILVIRTMQMMNTTTSRTQVMYAIHSHTFWSLSAGDSSSGSRLSSHWPASPAVPSIPARLKEHSAQPIRARLTSRTVSPTITPPRKRSRISQITAKNTAAPMPTARMTVQDRSTSTKKRSRRVASQTDWTASQMAPLEAPATAASTSESKLGKHLLRTSVVLTMTG
mmetsp:Transcript_21682/g.60288  ORF Transcript_21682/g.60288 Transcript_21682/m.60288 type:complete len:260 (-) Transcript_21682:832-1611(-)